METMKMNKKKFLIMFIAFAIIISSEVKRQKTTL